MSAVLDLVFEAMNAKPEDRGHLPDYAKRFPYVNGGLFRDKTRVPKFSKRARRLLKECGELYWKDINPDIFGSMIQAVAQPGLREDMGMHYTSVPNIMKALQPLFLLSLEEEFLGARNSEPKLKKLLQRIYNIRVFDPACGSGNFLIIAYKELRRLEMRIFERQKEIAKQWSLPMTGVRLTQFFGIELTDFATETAKLSLWIAEYQMNELFKDTFGSAPPMLPLRDSGNIVHSNATRINWLSVCPMEKSAEIFVVGNPPYLGSNYQTQEQKDDLKFVFSDHSKKFKVLDYVTCWYFKAAEFCRDGNAQFAFVSTNSICQGEQAGILWPLIHSRGLEIGFAHQSFKWQNSAKGNAGVTCIVTGIRHASNEDKHLISGGLARKVKNIGPYLIEMDNSFVLSRSKSIGFQSVMTKGSQATDDGNLILLPSEKDELLATAPQAAPLIRRFVGGQEFLKGIERWCIWIDDDTRQLASSIPAIAKRLEQVEIFRAKSKKKQTRKFAALPHRLTEIRYANRDAIIAPRVSSETRSYYPVGMLPIGTVVSDQAFCIYGAEEYILAILSSKMHAIWLATVAGRMKTDFRYSNTLVYNTFPIPILSPEQKLELEDHAVSILGAREAHPGRKITYLYSPKTMPDNLLKAHIALDETLENIYIGRTFRSDAERLEHLFKLYASQIKKEKKAKESVRAA